MTFAMRVRLWARQAPRTQVITTILLGGALVATMAVMAIPASRSGNKLGVAGASRTNSGARSSASGQTAEGSAADGSNVATVTSNGSSVGSSRAVLSAGGAATGGDQSAITEAPVASDQGVTDKTIKLGFTIFKAAGLDATGFALGIRQDQRQVIKALIDDTNANGGVKGRSLDYVVRDVDTTNRATWQPVCLALTEDEKVFSVILPGNIQGSGHTCYLDHGVPAITNGAVTMPGSMIASANGYLVSSGPSADRAMLNWVSEMLDNGVIGPGKGKIGLLTDQCPEYVDVWTNVESTLHQAGVDVTAVQTSCDIGAAQQQVPSAVLQMRQAGVTRVFLGSIFSTAQTFMQQADAQAWKPQYSVSDLWANNVNFTAKNFPPSQFDRTIGTAHNFSGGEAAQVPYSPGVQRCNSIITNAGLPPVTDQSGADAEVVSLCDAFFVWLAVTDKLPVNFTRADWATAVPQVGQFQMATSTASATFGPGKFEGGDAYALVEWRQECTCWFEIRGHQPAKY